VRGSDLSLESVQVGFLRAPDSRDLVVELDSHLSSALCMQAVYAIDRLLLRTTKLEALAYEKEILKIRMRGAEGLDGQLDF
jgi:hypothetical protein